MLALDNGVPPKTNTTVLTLTVNRNLHDPKFSQFLFEVTIEENQPVGVPVLTLNGSDADNTVRYLFTTNKAELIKTTFL